MKALSSALVHHLTSNPGKLLFAILAFCLFVASNLFAVTVQYEKNDVTEDASATTHTCAWSGGACPSGPTHNYLIEVCNEGTKKLYVDFTGATAVNDGSTTTSKLVRAGKCFSGYFDNVSFSAIVEAGQTTTMDYTFKKRLR